MKLVNDCVLCTVLLYATIALAIYTLFWPTHNWWISLGCIVMSASTIFGHWALNRASRRIQERIRRQHEHT
jgi:uncharacterized membrane protein YqjE